MNYYIKRMSQEKFRMKVKKEQAVQSKKYINDYQKKTSILTNNEKAYFRLIRSAMKETNYIVYPQVLLATVIQINSNEANKGALFKIIDFCILNKFTLEPVCMIEINDSSHNSYDRIERDEKVKSILKSCNLPLLTINTFARCTNIMIRDRVIKLIELSKTQEANISLNK